MTLHPRTSILSCVLVAMVAWAGWGCSKPGDGAESKAGIPQLDQRARALKPEATCVAPARRAETGPSPRCAFAFGRAVGALGIPPDGSPAVISLVHAATGAWSLPAAEYLIGFDPLPAESEAQAILASATRDTALLAVAGDLLGYRLSSGKLVARAAGPGGMIADLGWSGDGEWIVLTAGGKAAILDSSGKVVRPLPVDGNALHVAIDASAAHAVVGSDVGSITIFGHASDSAPRVVTPSLQPAAELGFAGDLLWVAGSDGILRALDPDTGAEKAHVDVGAPLAKLAIAPDGKHAATAARDRTIRVHELPSGKVVAELGWHQAQVVALGWGAGGTLLSGDGDGQLAVWDVKP